jgi:putative nucleotidyltransferase with HDIG domain
MNVWLSKFREQRLKERQREAARKTSAATVRWWNRSSWSILIGALVWLSASLLLYSHQTETPAEFTLALTLASSQLLLLFGVLFTAGFLSVLTPDVLRSNARLLLLALISVVTLLPSEVLLYVSSNSPHLPLPVAQYLFPLSAAPLLGTLLLGPAAGTVVGLWSSYAAAILAGRSLTVFILGLVATAVACVMARSVRRRSQLIRIGVMIGLAELLTVVALIDRPAAEFPLALMQSAACIASGLAAAIATILLLPACETLFGLTTNIRLLELSDLGHPLLQRLALEAPGTYHHSLMVANLAQSAAEAIGANSLLARVAAYFHDIGKLTKPNFFTENIQMDLNPHDELAPSMSSLLVMAHVKEGLSLAMLHHLPPPLLDAIQQHHGTGLVAYFHHKAGQQRQTEQQEGGRAARREAVVDESQYRYPGPRPLTKEVGIISLADAVEAASRSLEKPTPGHIRELVDRIVDARIGDGQLGQCDLTLAELSTVKRAFVFCLTNMLHSRVAYPKP